MPSVREGEQPSVLVVDDEALVRFIAVAILEDEGFQVLEAGDVREAMALLQADAITIDLVFSDIQMPGGLDGCDLARWVRDNRPGMPVILASGRVTDGSLPNDLSWLAPIEGKPYAVETLTNRMRAALKQRHRLPV